MASITNPWSDNTAWAGTNLVSAVDDHFRDVATDVEERLKNGGHVWDSATQARDGVHAITADNYVANEWTVYGEASLSTKVLALTNSLGSLGVPLSVAGTLATTGNATVGGYVKTEKARALTIESVTASEEIDLGKYLRAATIERVDVVLRGTGVKVTGQLYWAPSRDSSGTGLWASNQEWSNTTTGAVSTSFANATMSSSSYLWLETSAVSGTVLSMVMTVFTRED